MFAEDCPNRCSNVLATALLFVSSAHGYGDESHRCYGVKDYYIDQHTNIRHPCKYICSRDHWAFIEHCKAYCPEFYKCWYESSTSRPLTTPTPVQTRSALAVISGLPVDEVVAVSLTIIVAVALIGLVYLFFYRRRVKRRRQQSRLGRMQEGAGLIELQIPDGPEVPAAVAPQGQEGGDEDEDSRALARAPAVQPQGDHSLLAEDTSVVNAPEVHSVQIEPVPQHRDTTITPPGPEPDFLAPQPETSTTPRTLRTPPHQDSLTPQPETSTAPRPLSTPPHQDSLTPQPETSTAPRTLSTPPHQAECNTIGRTAAGSIVCQESGLVRELPLCLGPYSDYIVPETSAIFLQADDPQITFRGGPVVQEPSGLSPIGVTSGEPPLSTRNAAGPSGVPIGSTRSGAHASSRSGQQGDAHAERLHHTSATTEDRDYALEDEKKESARGQFAAGQNPQRRQDPSEDSDPDSECTHLKDSFDPKP